MIDLNSKNGKIRPIAILSSWQRWGDWIGTNSQSPNFGDRSLMPTYKYPHPPINTPSTPDLRENTFHEDSQ